MPRLNSKFKLSQLLLLATFLITFALNTSTWAEQKKPVTNINRSWSNTELTLINSLLLTHLTLKQDPSNAVLSNPKAISFGKLLFNDRQLSNNSQVSCASCHLKEHAFTDNKLFAMGERVGTRNTPTLLNIAQQDWFFWDGKKDSLWAQALSSMENPAEHNFSRTELLHVISKNSNYVQQYQDIFKEPFPLNQIKALPKVASPNGHLKALIAWKKLSQKQKKRVNLTFTNLGKVIASYVSTIKSVPTRFDHFATELNNKGSSNIYSAAEKRGLKLFISQKSGCINCHSGAIFSNKGFHNIGTGIPAKDNGRSEVIDAVIHDPFNCLGEYSDAKPEECMELKYAKKDRHALAGNFKTPTLRSISRTAPYMHDGRYKNLKEVIKHYLKVSKDQTIDTDLPIIKLDQKEQEDLIKFLLTL